MLQKDKANRMKRFYIKNNLCMKKLHKFGFRPYGIYGTVIFYDKDTPDGKAIVRTYCPEEPIIFDTYGCEKIGNALEEFNQHYIQDIIDAGLVIVREENDLTKNQ